MWTKIKDFLEGIWHFLVKLAMEVWAPFSDYQWHLDPWKLGGFGSIGLATFFSFQANALILAKADIAYVTIEAGLVGSFITVATFLFGQSHNVDKAMIDKDTTNGGQ